MIHIAHILDARVPPSVRFYRTQGVFSWLEKQSGGLFRFTEVEQSRFLSHETNAQPYDIALVERPVTPESSGIIQMCIDQGVKVWLDYDDNLLSIPQYNKSGDYYEIPQNADLVKRNLQAASLVTVTTDYLRDLYAGFNRNVITCPNAWNDYRLSFAPIREASRPIRMAWRGSDTHFGDVYAVRGPLAKSLQDPAFAWTFFGYRPPFLNVPRQNYRPWSGLFSYFRTIAANPPDFLFVPLEDNPFNRSKSNCALIEGAGLAGAVVVAPMAIPEFDRPGVIRYKDSKHLETIFSAIKAGKYDKAEQVEASRDALPLLSDVNQERARALGDLLGLRVGERVENTQ